ncbi:inositol monophosphatase family protein, partial [Dermatophilus congolensis]
GRRRRLRVSGTTDLGQSLVATGFAYASERRAEQGVVLAALLPRIRDVRRCGSAALDMCDVAAGTLDAYYERGVHVWDVAAARLIAQEAGAVVSGIGAEAPLADGVIAAAPGVHGALREALSVITAPVR